MLILLMKFPVCLYKGEQIDSYIDCNQASHGEFLPGGVEGDS